MYFVRHIDRDGRPAFTRFDDADCCYLLTKEQAQALADCPQPVLIDPGAAKLYQRDERIFSLADVGNAPAFLAVSERPHNFSDTILGSEVLCPVEGLRSGYSLGRVVGTPEAVITQGHNILSTNDLVWEVPGTNVGRVRELGRSIEISPSGMVYKDHQFVARLALAARPLGAALAGYTPNKHYLVRTSSTTIDFISF